MRKILIALAVVLLASGYAHAGATNGFAGTWNEGPKIVDNGNLSVSGTVTVAGVLWTTNTLNQYGTSQVQAVTGIVSTHLSYSTPYTTNVLAGAATVTNTIVLDAKGVVVTLTHNP
jgi:hypothetical protein